MKLFFSLLLFIAVFMALAFALLAQEIDDGQYTDIHNYAKEYPQLTPMIKDAMNNGYISYGERGHIIQKYNALKKRKLLEIDK